MGILRRLASIVVIATAVTHSPALWAAEPVVKPEDLPRVKATEPADAIKTFQVRPGFHVELVAAEPNVIDPIAMCFDENGRMFVVEMRDYSERRAEKLGRIRMLQDVDGDGVYEKSTVFIENLPWPTAVACWKGGILIGACPDIIYAKDTNGDGVADEKKVLFTGFGSTQEKLNVQGLFNNFIWGLDNRIHGCSGHDGGMVSATAMPTPQPLDVRNKGFVIDPRDGSMTTEAGGGQYGLSFDHLGRLFTCSNSVHIETFMYDAKYAALNPYVTLPDPRICIAADGPAAEVYRISPEEPWRVIRTRWRVGGLVPGMIEGGGRSAGYFTGATGVTIYKGDAFGPDYIGDAFIGDAGGNLAHHKRVRPGPDGIQPIAERPGDEHKLEFVASTDNWFRPVDFANAPDGTLYIADMYREVIEHPWSIPPNIKQYLDLNSGNDRGRIYRIAPDGFKPRKPPKLGDATTEELIALLDHPNGWHRETAARLLFERQDDQTIAKLTALQQKKTSAVGRIHALYAEDGQGHLDAAEVIAALQDVDPRVREHAIRLAEHIPESPAILERLSAMADDPDPRVRYQLAWSLGVVPYAERTKILQRLAHGDLKSKWMRAAIANSLTNGAGEVFLSLSGATTSESQAFLEQLADMIGAKHDEAEVKAVVAAIRSSPRPFPLARALADGARRTGASDQVHIWLRDVIGDAKTVAIDPKAKISDRIQAIALLGYGTDSSDLVMLLSDGSQSVQLAALGALDQCDASKLASQTGTIWPKLSPRSRQELIRLLLKRPEGAIALLDGVRACQVPAADIAVEQAQFLRDHADARVHDPARQLLPPPPSRADAISAMKPAIELTGDAVRGHVIYAQRCISCHRSADEGFLVGPDFVTIKNSGREKMLFSILDPNREVAANYIAYLVETKDGESVLGMISSDTPQAITLRQAYGKESVINRSNIKRMTSQKKSVMPEGLEAGLKPQDMADLIEFISGAQAGEQTGAQK